MCRALFESHICASVFLPQGGGELEEVTTKVPPSSELLSQMLRVLSSFLSVISRPFIWSEFSKFSAVKIHKMWTWKLTGQRF